MNRIETILHQCDAHIRSGNSREVHNILAQVNVSQLPRVARLPLARICRRAGLYSMGLRLLGNLLQNKKMEPQPAEVAEYAALLLRSGAVIEAIDRLEKIDAVFAPEILLFRSYCHFAQWDYATAIPNLRRYIELAPTDQARLVGIANLAVAQVECYRHDEAEQTIADLRRLAVRLDHAPLERNSHALAAQVRLQEFDFAAARREIREAGDFRNGKTYDEFAFMKLGLILDAMENKSLKPLHDLRKLATESRHWGALREVDLYSLRIDFNFAKALYLYFGSPFEAFRKGLVAEFPALSGRDQFVLGTKSAPRFDLAHGTLDGRQIVRPAGQIHRLLEVLLRDLYVPLRVGGLFSGLFANERFDVGSSSDRVHQVIRRTRKWIDSESLPLSIASNQGFYSLQVARPFSVRIHLGRQPLDPRVLQFETLKAKLENPALFTNRETREALDLSLSSARRFLIWAFESGRIERLGDSKASTRYRLTA